MHQRLLLLSLCALAACDSGITDKQGMTLGSSTPNGSSSSTLSSATQPSSSGPQSAISTAGTSSSPTSSPTSSSSSTQSAPNYSPCTIDVSKVGADCGPGNSASCDGVDIAMNYAKYPDPYAFFTDLNNPGITLLKGSACQRNGVQLTWNNQAEQCILNGQGYPISADHVCSSGKYSALVSPSQYQQFVSSWYNMAMNKSSKVFQASAGADAYVVKLKLEDGTPIEAALSMGHGVLDGKCGDAFLVKVKDKYVLLLQTDIRAWSLELSPGANTWLDPNNVGGTCIIPEVRKIDPNFVIKQF